MLRADAVRTVAEVYCAVSVVSVLITPSVLVPKRREPVWVTPEVVVGIAEKKNVAAIDVVEAVRPPTKL